jgi:hypothetical protein
MFCLPVCLSKNLTIQIYVTVIFPVVLFGCDTWSLTLQEELRLTVVENRVLRRIFEHKRDEGIGDWEENYMLRSLMICTPHQILFG